MEGKGTEVLNVNDDYLYLPVSRLGPRVAEAVFT